MGYQAKLIDPGKSYFSVGYGRGENWQANGDEADAIQFGFKQDISAAATELYLSISRIALDTSTTTNYEDIVWGMAGARVSSKRNPGRKARASFPARTEPSPSVVGPVAATRKFPRAREGRGVFPV